jgi:hypothetical protein
MAEDAWLEACKKGVPVAHPKFTKISDICNEYEDHNGKKVKRWLSTWDEKTIRDAVLLLTITDCGFSIAIEGPAYQVQGVPHNHVHDAVLAIRRSGFGAIALGPKDYWHIYFNGNKLETFDDPEKAVDFFMKIRNEVQVGHDMTELNFSGHGCPSRIYKEIEEEEAKEE